MPSFGATLNSQLVDDHAAGARHVLHHDGRLARNVLAQILGEGAGIGVVAAARRGADQHADGLALVEVGRTGQASRPQARMARAAIKSAHRGLRVLTSAATVRNELVRHKIRRRQAATPQSAAGSHGAWLSFRCAMKRFRNAVKGWDRTQADEAPTTPSRTRRSIPRRRSTRSARSGCCSSRGWLRPPPSRWCR